MAQQLPPIPSTANQGPHLASTFDQYFDLSTRRFDHLERPFLLRNVVESTAAMDEGAFIAYCRSKILKGDPLGGRDVVPDFEGSSTQRGGLMVFSNFELLRFQQTAPRFDGTAFHGTNGVGIAADLSYTRRSDALFCQQLVERHGVDCQLKRRLAVLHCNESDAVASPQKMRSLEVQEILGAMVCRKPSDRIAFVEQRLLALEMNVWRIRGIAQTLRGRPKGHQSLALLAFLDELDVIFRPSTWQEEVTLVVRREAKRLCDWAIQIREINVVEGDTRLCSVDGALGALCLPYLKTTDATRAIVTRLFPVQQAHTGTEKHLGTVILTTMSLLRNSRLLKLDLSLENFERPETMVMAKGAWLQLDTLKENDEVKTLLLDAMCKQAFFCFRFAKWGQAHLLDHCTALSAILPWNIASRTTQTYNRLTGFDNFMKLLVLAEDFDITTRTPSQCHSRYFPTGHMIIDPTSFSNDASLAAFVLKTHVSAAVDASVHMVIEDPFWQFAPANQEPNTRRSLSYLTRLLRRTGFVIEKEESVETIDPRHFEIYVSHHVFTLRKLPTAQDMPKVALMIKTCPLDYTTIVPNVQHIISTLDTCNFSEIVLLVDRSRSNDFLRQFVDNIDLQQYDAALTQIRAERLVDRVIDFDGSCKEMDPSQINHRWFGKDHPATHSEQGAQYASTFYGFEQIEADLILQTDSDIIFTGRAEIARINLLRKYSELFAADEAMLTAGFPIVTTNPAPLGWRHLCMVANEYDGLESTYPLEVRCSFIHRGRLLKCLPFKIPDYAAGESHSPFLINKQLEGWYRVVDANIRSSGGRLRSYRGSIGLESGFVHPPNTIKADLMRYMFIVDRIACTPRRAPTVTCNKADSVERNIIHSESKQDPRWREQLDHVELQHTIDWFSERAEDIIFVCCGFRHSAARVLRCLESIARQRGISECGVIVLDDATENYGDVRECIRSKALELFGAHRVSCISTGVHNGFLANTTHSILNSCCNPESIIVTLDQDDMLLGDNVVTYIQQIFSSDPNVECAIGGGVRTDTPQTFPLNVQNPRLNRGGGNTWQHLRAFRKHLFSRIKPGDMKDSSGKWIDFAADWVFMIPIVEMAKKTFAIPPDAALYLFEPSEAPRDGVEANGARSDQEERISVTAALLQARCSYARCTDWEETFLPTELCGGCHFRVCPPSDGVQVQPNHMCSPVNELRHRVVIIACRGSRDRREHFILCADPPNVRLACSPFMRVCFFRPLVCPFLNECSIPEPPRVS